MVFDEKPAKTLKLRRWKLRGLKQNQVSIPNYIYQNDQHKKIYLFGDFERKTPTHISAIHAFSKKFEKK